MLDIRTHSEWDTYHMDSDDSPFLFFDLHLPTTCMPPGSKPDVFPGDNSRWYVDLLMLTCILHTHVSLDNRACLMTLRVSNAYAAQLRLNYRNYVPGSSGVNVITGVYKGVAKRQGIRLL